MTLRWLSVAALLPLVFLSAMVPAVSDRKPSVPARGATVSPGYLSPQVNPIVVHGGLVYAANTPAGTLDVLDTATRRVVARIPTGLEPVSLALRPGGNEIWVSNHVSDTVSIVDIAPRSATRNCVVATVQDLDPKSRATRFDEPSGIAFAGPGKAYVALSSTNRVAVVDAEARVVRTHIAIAAQEPRAIAVHGNRLYVASFESGNRTQLSGGTGKLDNDLATFDAYQHSIFNNNVLSLGAVVDIVRHPQVPDHDVFVVDTNTDRVVGVVDGAGTLLYGLAASPDGAVYLATTEARNDANGRAGTKGHTLRELANRPFLNRIVQLERGSSTPRFLELEPVPPAQPAPGTALATPHAIAVADRGNLLVATASGSDCMVTVDPRSGKVLGRVAVGAAPQGVAVEEGPAARPRRAWVLNAVSNSVSVVELSDPRRPRSVGTIALDDPTPSLLRRGRAHFQSAKASTTETFSCASCHPDGHTDQLLWVLDTPVVSGAKQIMPRSTMPLRGLRDTEPFHWDGIPGDPYGGNNSAHTAGDIPPNVDGTDPLAAIRHLTDGSLGSTMKAVDDKLVNDEGKKGRLSRTERSELSAFLLSLPFPPAPERAWDDRLSETAQAGFRLFHIDGDIDPSKPEPNVCGDCHRLPFLVSTNTPGSGMDAPTWRGAQDRWLILPQGRLNMVAFDFYKRIAEAGAPEQEIWKMSWGGRARFNPVWNMVVEGSTGMSGAFGRQVGLERRAAQSTESRELLTSLERSAGDGSVVLEVSGIMDGKPGRWRFSPTAAGYVSADGGSVALKSNRVWEMVTAGRLVGTATAGMPGTGLAGAPQPALWTRGALEQQRGRQNFPAVFPGFLRMTFSGRHISPQAAVFIDGRRVRASLAVHDNLVDISNIDLPTHGLHFLQVRNPDGWFSNEVLFRSKASATGERSVMVDAILAGDTALVRNLLDHGAPLEGVDGSGNTPLHVAAFLGRTELVRDLLARGASPTRRNRSGQTAVDVVSDNWNPGLAAFARAVGRSAGVVVDTEALRETRRRIARLLRQASP